jgi:hypothetical protein
VSSSSLDATFFFQSLSPVRPLFGRDFGSGLADELAGLELQTI